MKSKLIRRLLDSEKKHASLVLFVATLVLQIPEAHAARWYGAWTRVYEGVEYIEAGDSSPLQKVFAARIDLRNPEVGIGLTLGNGAAWGDTTLQTTPDFANQYGLEVAINANMFTVNGNNADLMGPSASDGNIISGAGPYNYECFHITQDKIPTFFYSTAQPIDWWDGCAGDVRPLIDGVTNDGWKHEIEPRTAVAASADGRYLYFIVIDGRQTGWSVGASWQELGQWCKDLGAWNALSLDGGGSSCFTLGGVVKNSPSDGVVRAVGNNLGVNTYACNTTGASADSMNSNRVDIVQRGKNSNVLLRTWTSTNGWTNTDLGGATYDTPAIVSRKDGVLDVFVRGSNTYLHQNHYENGVWSGWVNLGVDILHGPAVCSMNSNSITIAVVGTVNNDACVRTWTTTNGWGSWSFLGGTTYESPAIVSRDQDLNVFVKGTDGHLNQKQWTAAGGWWTTWVGFGDYLASAVSACSRSTNNIELFYRGVDGALWNKRWNAGSGWTGSSMGGGISGVPAVCSPYEGWLSTWERGTDDNLYQLSWTSGGGWGGFVNLGAFYW